MHRSFLIFAAAFMALMAGALFYAARIPVEQAAPPQPVAQPGDVVEYPSFTLAGLDGEPRDFSEFDGRHRLLNFWATWCAPCRREIPLLNEFHAEQGEDGILVIGIAVDFADAVNQFAEEFDIAYPVLVGEQDAIDVAEQSGIAFNAMPFTMIVGRDGRLLGAYLGELHRKHLSDIATILGRLDREEISVESARGALQGL